ncbi:diacylglycerol kinase [Flavihumibacter sp. UBA7668]|uniref:diacylglycerol kinase n=1 Tax=Flavihumibacter sp. UBA7668 TaxID=1946542 RepID=UPI0025C5C640|nr:diacylglycerol kinase [Flavihumibacter sp. UBA7668]
MQKQLKFNGYYFCWTILLFLTEVLMEKYVHDTVIRPYVGDLLVVILLYCFVRSFFNFSIKATAFGVLFFAYGIEVLQYLNFIKLIGLQDYYWANMLMGNYFEWMDLVAYSMGIVLVLLFECWLVPIYKNSFSAAWQGILVFFKEESNTLVHLFSAVGVVLLAFLLKVGPLEWIALLSCINLVWVSEIINSSIETMADFICPQRDDRIKKIKDLAAGAVLVAAIFSAIIAAMVFVPKLILLFK